MKFATKIKGTEICNPNKTEKNNFQFGGVVPFCWRCCFNFWVDLKILSIQFPQNPHSPAKAQAEKPGR